MNSLHEKKPFSISPSTGMMDIIGHSGYSFNYAIADLIDNCIAAHAKNVLIYINYQDSNPYIYILDDGNGMDLVKLKEAAVIGFKDITDYRDEDDLGRFSTGLKSATRSFCNNIIISSKTATSNINTIQIDFKHIHECKKWEAFELNEFKLSKLINETGTILYCDDLYNFTNKDSDVIFNKIDSLYVSLAHIFGKMLISNKIKIKIQTVNSLPIEVKGWNPFGLIDDKSTRKIYDNIFKYNDKTIEIKSYILPVYEGLTNTDKKYIESGKGLLEQSGFYIYRNNRLISEGGWLDLPNIKYNEKSKYARIEVNIPSSLDEEFEINFSKNIIRIPDDLVDLFSKIAKKARNESQKNANYIKHPELKKKLKTEEVKIWKTYNTNKGMVLTINQDHPLIKDISKDIQPSVLKKLFDTLSKSIPINMIQTQGVIVPGYTENEIIELIDEMYKKLKNDGMDLSLIKKTMRDMEPFKDYIELLVNYFEEVDY